MDSPYRDPGQTGPDGLRRHRGCNSELMRVVTLNVWGPGENWEIRRPVLVEGLRKLRPDLVALQETIVRAGCDQVRELFGDELTIVHQKRRQSRDGMGVSIVSRWPVRQIHELDLHLTDQV